MIYDFNLEIPDDFKRPTNPFFGSGKHCFLYECPDYIKKRFNLDNKKVVLKVFNIEPFNDGDDIHEINWGDDPTGDNPRINTTLIEATKIQNICWWNGLAPRVYVIGTVKYNDNIYPAQLTEDLRSDNVDKDKYMKNSAKNTRPSRVPIANFSKNHEEAEVIYEKVIELGEKIGFEVDKKDVAMWDVIDGKLIDFQTFAFNDDYIPNLKSEYSEKTKWGKKHYHKIPELELNGGPRDMKTRIKELGLDKINFMGKTVLDLGCSGGLFVNYALEHGAKRVVGVDFLADTEGARGMSNELEYFNADYIDCDLREMDTTELRKRTGQEKFDIVFYLSMFRHVHFPSFIWEMCNDFALIEWNNWKTMSEIRELVETKFDIIESGPTTDHGSGKEYYKCIPKK